MTSPRFFDFDGCLFDTAYECAVVTWCVRENIVQRFSSVEPDAEFLSRFYALKPFVRYAREYVVFSSDAYLSMMDQTSLAAHVSSLSTNDLKSYESAYYRTREAMKAESFDTWLALNRPYEFAVNAMRSVAPEAIIISGKDRKTIVEMLSAIQLGDLEVYDFSYAGSKAETLRKLQKERGLTVTGAPFLDDNLDHLLEVEKVGVRPILAGWGYVSASQRAQAGEAGIAVACETTLRSHLGIED